MTQLTSILDAFDTVTLDEIESLKLFDRTEKKFIFNHACLPEILGYLSSYYKILEINNSLCNIYENMYFDTDDLEMYRDHHNGKSNRLKVRFRNYVNTNTSFFEIKRKNNKGRTQKSRIEIDNSVATFDQTSKMLLVSKTVYKPELLHPSLEVDYKRITLISKTNPERVTIDLDLHFLLDKEGYNYDNLVIAELKQPRSSYSVFNEVMHNLHIKPLSISKYCLGIATLNTSVKSNNFKKRIQYVNKICGNRN
jgi:hypothetical protein